MDILVAKINDLWIYTRKNKKGNGVEQASSQVELARYSFLDDEP